MSDYQPTTIRFNNAGIVLRDDAELLKEGNYLILQNLRSTFEGSLTGRAGHEILVEIPAAGVIHTLRRIDQDHVFIGTGQRGYSNGVLLTTVPPHFLPIADMGNLADLVTRANTPTQTNLLPAGQGTDDNWCISSGACGAAASAVKWQILAGAITNQQVLGAGASGVAPETYNFANLSIDTSSNITRLRLVAQATASQVDTIRFRARLNGVVSESAIFTGVGGTYNESNPLSNLQTFNWDEVERPGGGDWSVDDINSAEFGFSFHNWSAHSTPLHTTLTLEVTSTPPDPVEPTNPWDVFSGNPLATVPFTPLVGNLQWLYIGDTEVMLKTPGKPIEGFGEPGHSALLAQWGIDAPTGDMPNPPVVLTGTPGGLDSLALGATTYDWRYTYYSSYTGAESNPNDTMDTGVNVSQKSVQLTAKLSLDPQVDKVRFYRRGGTLNDGAWRLVGAGDNNNVNPPPNAVVTFVDGVSDQDLNAARFLDLDNFVPFPSENQEGDAVYGTAVPNIWGPFAGSYIMACGDENRPGHVYWTNPNRPDSADVANHVFVTPATEPLIRGFVFNGGNYVWSQDNLYALDYNGPGAVPTFVPRKTSVGRGTVAPFSYAVGGLIYFVHGSGIYETDGQTPPVSITELSIRPLFENRSYGGLEPVDFANPGSIKLTIVGTSLHFHYISTGATRTHLIYDLVYKRWLQDVTSGFGESVFYADENTAQDTLLVGTTVGTVLTADTGPLDESINGTASNINCRMRTGRIDLGSPNIAKEVDTILLDFSTLSNGSPITVNTYIDQGIDNPTLASLSTVITSNVTGQRAKFPLVMTGFASSQRPTYLYNFFVDVSWSGAYSEGNNKLQSLEVFWRPDKPWLTFWTQPDTTHGLSGWQMVRDVYLTMANSCPVIFTLNVDGIPYQYSIPANTSNILGRRQKVHIWIDPVKGKLFSYTLEKDPSTVGNPDQSSFKIYGELCEVRVKPWNTSLGYQLVSPWVGEGSA